MAKEVWEGTLQGVTTYGAYGPRDVLIVSSEGLEGPDIVPRRRGELSPQDKQRLSSQGIPEESWEEDERMMEERYGKDKRYTLIPRGSKEVLTCQNVKEKIRAVMKSTTKPGGNYHVQTYILC